ncbi:MAG TPA: hypothetical protein VME18_04910 [Acidobacteriaceae bacterium]|nr:hypothetical protein [Acidobacteriaceae bacterium]
MKSPRKFLGFISIETRRRRRTLVIGYYALFLVIMVLQLLFSGPAKYDRLLPIAYLAAAMLGGLTVDGPVRVFTQWQRNMKDGSAYGIDPVRLRRFSSIPPRPSGSAYDERDIATRDRAHYLAYSTLRWAMIILVLGMMVNMDWPSARVAQILLFLSVPFAVVFFSLPQAILLWCEPDLDPDPEDPGTQSVFKAIP